MPHEFDNLDWAKGDGLLPVIVQDAANLRVLMLGYMNAEALAATRASGFVTFYSRSKQRLWKKGETSSHVLELVSVEADCDNDTLLVLAKPQGPTLMPPSVFRLVQDFLLEIREAQNLLVLKTKVGSAQPVAAGHRQ